MVLRIERIGCVGVVRGGGHVVTPFDPVRIEVGSLRPVHEQVFRSVGAERKDAAPALGTALGGPELDGHRGFLALQQVAAEVDVIAGGFGSAVQCDASAVERG